MREFEYSELMKDDRKLLQWLKTMEVQGSAMLRNAPDKDDAGPELIEHMAYVKPSHFGCVLGCLYKSVVSLFTYMEKSHMLHTLCKLHGRLR